MAPPLALSWRGGPAATTLQRSVGQRAAGIERAEPVRLSVRPQAAASTPAAGQGGEAEMVFEVGQDLRVGYGGYLDCRQAPPAPAAIR